MEMPTSGKVAPASQAPAHSRASQTSGPSHEPPSTARGRKTRASLVVAAREIFEEHGLRDARIADIARRAGISYGSFYTYFDSKEAIFGEVINDVTGQMFQASRAGSGTESDPLARIEGANRAYLRAYASNARMMAVIEELSPYDPYFRDLLLDIRNMFVRRNEQGLRRLQEQGLADRGLDATIAASALGGMIERFAHVWLLMEERYDEEEAVYVLTRLWAQAIGLGATRRAPAGRKRS